MSLSELSDGAKPRPAPRTHDLMFHGSTTRGTRNDYVDGELRQLLCDNLGPALEGDHSLRCVLTLTLAQPLLPLAWCPAWSSRGT